MITTDALNALPTAAPPAATEPPAAPAPATPPAPPPGAPTGEDAAKTAVRSRKQTSAQRMAEATKALMDAVSAPQPATEPQADAPPAPQAEPGEPIEPDKIVWDQTANRYRDPATGNFVAAPEGQAPTAEPSAQAAEGTPAPAEGTEPEGEPAPETEWHEVTLPPLREGAEPVTFETDDPDAVELLNGYKNAAMRREEFNRRIEGVQSKESQFREFEAMLATSPEALVDTLSAENRARFTQYLLAQEFERLKPTLEAWYQNDLERQQALLSARERALQSRVSYDQMVAAQRWESSILRAVNTLVPDSASQEDAADFQTVATTRLAQLAQQGADVRPETVAFHLERDLRRFGFLPSETPAPETTPSLIPTTPAKSAPPASAAAVATKAGTTQQRLAAVAKDRQAAAAIVPAGTAAAPAVQPPPIRSFKDAEKALSQVDPAAWKQAWRTG